MRFKGFSRLPFYMLFGPLLAYISGLITLSGLMAADGASALLAAMWVYALPLTPLAWLVGLVPFVAVTMAAHLGGRLSAAGAYIAGAMAAAILYWVLAVIFFNPPRQFDGVEVSYGLLTAAPIGGAVGAAICEWLTGRFRQRKSAEAI